MPTLKITHKGVFVFKELYVILHDFLEQNEFTAHDFSEHGGDKDLFETSFLVKGTQKKNYIIKWKAVKEIPDTDYFRYTLDMKIEGRMIDKKEIVHEGKKMEVDSGEIVITIKGKVETDYKKEWEKHWLLKHFINIYDTKIMKDELDKTHEGTLFNDLISLQNTIKRYFKMQGGAETAPLFAERPGP